MLFRRGKRNGTLVEPIYTGWTEFRCLEDAIDRWKESATTPIWIEDRNYKTVWGVRPKGMLYYTSGDLVHYHLKEPQNKAGAQAFYEARSRVIMEMIKRKHQPEELLTVIDELITSLGQWRDHVGNVVFPIIAGKS